MSTKKKRIPKEKEEIKQNIDDNHLKLVRLNIKTLN
jgi:hypothetical protein